MDIIKTIQEQIRKSDKSRYRISIETGLDESLLFRVYHGKTDLSCRHANILLDYFNYELREKEGK